jgi:hypothetical protein
MKPRTWLFAALTLAACSPAIADGCINQIGAAPDPARRAHVPVVKCVNYVDGNLSEDERQTSHPSEREAPLPAASRLAYYTTGYVGVLAPRGWSCVTFENPGGFEFWVTPEPYETTMRQPLGTGPFVRIFAAVGDSNFSQHLAIATIAARFFPQHAAYVKEVIAENESNGGDHSFTIPIGPLPADRVTRRSATVVEFVTQPNQDGTGTEFGIAKNAFPVFGAAFLPLDESGVRVVAVRLPDGLKKLATTIVASANPQP